MSLVGSNDACSDDSLIRLRAGTPQCDEEQQQICAKLRNIYQIPIFRPAMQDFFRAVNSITALKKSCMAGRNIGI